METLKQINLYMALPLVGLIWLYQKTLSPDHGPIRVFYPYGYCKFYPTCSEYAKQTLKKQGLVGLPKIFIRISKCNPMAAPTVDLPRQN